jgi:hypothetical protein
MEIFTTQGKAVGIVLDISLRHNEDGIRIISVVKKKLVEFVKSNMDDGQDALYLYHPQIFSGSYKIGEHTAAIGNYNTDGCLFSLDFALKQTLYVIANEDQDFDKHIIFITDRVQNPHPLEKLLYLNSKDRIDAKITLIGVGDYYNKGVCELMQKLANETGKTTRQIRPLEYIHLDGKFELPDTLLKETAHGDQDICGQTNEHSE